MPDTVHARHPDPSKQGVSIAAEKYHAVRAAIEAVLDEQGEVGFEPLMEAVDDRIGSTFDGSVPWYVTTVKLDLEARGVIERVPGARPQRLRRAAGGEAAG